MLNLSGEWSLIAHGGAKDILPYEEDTNRKGLQEALAVGSGILQQGGTALETVEAVVKILEINPAYNAGFYGSVKNEAGQIEMDASIMDGRTLNIGAIAGLNHVRHPVMVARALLDEKAILIAGEGGMIYAQEKGFVENLAPDFSSNNSPGCDTVGCVARDQYGSLAVATSTGGLEGTKVGRIGDSPLPGCGFYADDKRGAVSASGEGEAISRILLASALVHRLETLPPDEAVASALKLLENIGGEAGLIAINPKGEIGWDHTSLCFAVGLARHDMMTPKVFLKKAEENGQSG